MLLLPGGREASCQWPEHAKDCVCHWVCCQWGEQEPALVTSEPRPWVWVLSQQKNVKSECPVFSTVDFCDPVQSLRQWHSRDLVVQDCSLPALKSLVPLPAAL